ncbi:MAG: hypothetical protein HY922_05245 [Elusimicrobia bacterium]|nr:hypothetical protein [Elusimicrobiota bacterium]
MARFTHQTSKSRWFGTSQINAIRMFGTEFMAKSCKGCPLCVYARENPQHWFGRLMAWHGKYCPFWKAYDEIYGQERGGS